jgi:hypothetical protein
MLVTLFQSGLYRPKPQEIFMANEYLTLTLDTGNGQGGDVVIRLRPDLAPGHVARIKELVSEGFYDGISIG